MLHYKPFAANRKFAAAARNAPPMRPGTRGSHVQLLQGALIDLGQKMPKSRRHNGKLDGVYGNETFAAVCAFQGANKLIPDGVAGGRTVTTLDRLIAKKAKPVPPPTFNMFEVPYSQEYTLGTSDPPRRHDPGSGAWKSQPRQMVTEAQMAGIYGILPGAYVAIGDDAVKHLVHYFGNTGTPLQIDVRGMVNEVPSAKVRYKEELAQAKSFVEKLTPGKYNITSKRLNGAYNRQKENRNWFFAVGGYSSWGKGKVEVLPGPMDRITLDFEYCVYDRYNWDAGKSVTILDITITDHFMGEFHRQGLAQEYDEVGSFTRQYSWKRGQALPIPEGPI